MEPSLGIQLALQILTFAMAFVGVWTKIFRKPRKNTPAVRKEKRLAILGLILFASVLSLQGWQAVVTYNAKSLLSEQLDNTFSTVSEASGGVTIGEFVYLVSDDQPVLFKAPIVSGEKEPRYSNEAVTDINLYADDPLMDEKQNYPLTKKEVDDFEAAAYHKKTNKIYIITSHSHDKNEEEKSSRQRFLEVTLGKIGTKEAGIVTRWANLRDGLARALFDSTDRERIADEFEDQIIPGSKKVKTVMEIEGLAVDDGGSVYIGFRGPKYKKSPVPSAIILRTTLDEIFAPDPDEHKWKPKIKKETISPIAVNDEAASKKSEKKKRRDWSIDDAEMSPAGFAPFFIRVGGDGENDERGIVDMIDHGDSLLILTNSIFKIKKSENVEIRKWKKNDESGNTAIYGSSGFFRSPKNLMIKPEVLLLPENFGDWLFLFLDATTIGGGQRVYERKIFER